MSSSIVDEITDVVRSDHTKWKCRNCTTMNTMATEECTGCQKSRLNQSWATLDSGEIIGRNAGKNAEGKEEWYYTLQTNGNR
ncbi:hypothetical protein FSHL1_002935 [Fusarium sambucinum]